ncbi:exported hypothetical protein [Candidatus Sulfotelmatomonas gaucii]|uniref:Lipoprotein n=1 Tax=Candidatus Sulfuritelmatomonas gaucii TaxID=2043161 RepID=A0A2N9L3M9_9BACT|nr:exported hypothetical protein [Candidatus Sulfotelmatomonas gaucii]
MTKRALQCILIGVLALTAAGCRGPSLDWNGTWKLDPARSNIPGPTLTLSLTPDGMFYSSGRSGSAKFRCDGKAYQAAETLTAFCTQKNSSDLEITTFRNGSKAGVSHWQLSSNGKMLTVDSEIFQPDRSPKPKETHFTRTSGSSGFTGGWRNVNPFDGLASILQISMGSNALHYSYPEKDIHADAFIDGTDAAIQDPSVSAGATVSLRERGPREFSVTTKLNGRATNAGYWQISADGRSLTDSYWEPGRPNEKAVLVYEKQ